MPIDVSAVLFLACALAIGRAAGSLLRLDLGRRFWLAAALAAGVLIILHLCSVPYVDDIRPSTGLHRPSPAWAWLLARLPGPLTPQLLAHLNLGLALALLVPALALLVGLFDDRAAALAALFFLAASAVFVKLTASTGPQILLLLCGVAAVERTLAWTRTGSGVDVVLVATLLGGMANLRPEGAIGILAVLVVVVARARRTPEWIAFGIGVALYLVLALTPVVNDVAEIRSVGRVPWTKLNPLYYLAFPFFARSPYLPTDSLLVSAVLLAAVGVVVWKRAPERGAVLLLAMLSASASLGRVVTDNVTNHRYVVLGLAFQALFAGGAVYVAARTLLRHWRPGADDRWIALRSQAVAVVLLGLFFLPTRAFLGMQWSHTVEYELLLRSLAQVPDEAVVLVDLADRREAGLILRDANLPALAGTHQRLLDFTTPLDLPPRGEAYLYLGGSCHIRQADGQGGLPPETFTDIYPPCRTVKETLAQRAEVTLVERVDAPGAPFNYDRPMSATIPLELYRVTGR